MFVYVEKKKEKQVSTAKRMCSSALVTSAKLVSASALDVSNELQPLAEQYRCPYVLEQQLPPKQYSED